MVTAHQRIHGKAAWGKVEATANMGGAGSHKQLNMTKSSGEQK